MSTRNLKEIQPLMSVSVPKKWDSRRKVGHSASFPAARVRCYSTLPSRARRPISTHPNDTLERRLSPQRRSRLGNLSDGSRQPKPPSVFSLRTWHLGEKLSFSSTRRRIYESNRVRNPLSTHVAHRLRFGLPAGGRERARTRLSGSPRSYFSSGKRTRSNSPSLNSRTATFL
jgi:hypothetical protein